MRYGLKALHLVVLLSLLVGLLAHGGDAAKQDTALHWGPQVTHVMGQHHAQCDAQRSCLPQGNEGPCCVLGQCLIGIPVAAPAAQAPLVRPAAPEIVGCPHMSRWAPGNPDPPPRLA